jgi:hypothetical protein
MLRFVVSFPPERGSAELTVEASSRRALSRTGTLSASAPPELGAGGSSSASWLDLITCVYTVASQVESREAIKPRLSPLDPDVPL